jgi:hypothetical protein
MKYLNEIKKFIGSSVKYDSWGGGYIWGVYTENKGEQMLAQVVDVDEPPYEGREPETPIVSIRGWGAIQNLFNSVDEQEEFQDELGKFIAEAINEKLQKI